MTVVAFVGLWSVLDATIELLHGSNVALLVDGLLWQWLLLLLFVFELRTWFDEDIDACSDDGFCS